MKLLGATIHHGDDCVTRITNSIPGLLILNNSKRVAVILSRMLIDVFFARTT